jgi:hypothetical protein
MSGAKKGTLRGIADRLAGLERRAEAAGLARLAEIIRSARVEAEKARRQPQH